MAQGDNVHRIEATEESKKSTWAEFTQEVTMHGIRYVHLSNLHPVMR